jgi:hypothetical protein
MVSVKLHNARHILAAGTHVGTSIALENTPEFGSDPRGMNLYASLVVGSGTKAICTFQQSPDGTTWATGRFYKWSGVSTGPVATSCKLSGSVNMIFGQVVHLAPYNRVFVRSSGTKSTVATIQGWVY